jgi:DNA polymerase II small subunit
MKEEILKSIREKGLLLEKEIFDLVSNLNDTDALNFINTIEKVSGQKIITKSILNKNIEYVQKIASGLEGEEKNKVESVFVKLGISLEIRKEKEIVNPVREVRNESREHNYQVFYSTTRNDKKLEVADFVGHFRARYQQMQRLLMSRAELANLVAINKIGSERKVQSVIGIVIEKRVTKNKNVILKLEDLTGEISVLFKPDKEESYKKVEEVQVDDIIGIRASGSREILFGFDVVFPDSFIAEKVRFDDDISIAFISDIHAGGGKHLKEEFERFLEWINSEDENARKIKYLFIVGDNIDGVGVFPSQERLLEIKSSKGQYDLLASYLSRIPKNITMFMCPGQHDSVRLAEPQPIIDRRYGGKLYEIENLVLVSNPCMIKLMEAKKEFRVLMYHGDSIHDFITSIPELREMKAHKCPAKAVRYMLKRRHLAPFHSKAVYIPNAERDPMVITEVPDVLCTGEVHRLDIENYNGTVIITGSCWQGQTEYEEKVGNIPDPGKVPVLNLKTRELKVFNFCDDNKEVKVNG